MKQYEAVTKNVGTIPRTTSEAYRDAEYAYPIQRFKSEYDDAKEFVIGFLQVSLVISLVGLIAYAVWQLIVTQ